MSLPRAVLEAAERGLLPGTYLAVGSAIETDKDYSLAIETALGASANDLIVENESEAKRAIAWLKENRAGRCTFQPISLMRTSEVSNELRKVLNEKGVIGRASELVDCDSKVRPVIDSLLGRIVIVDLLEDALKLAKTHGWTRIVTLDGEVVHSSGAVAGGQNNKQSYGIVQRKADFINTCDAMIHARERGESFGLSIAEFLSLNKPVLAWNNGHDLNHLDMLKDSGLLYNDASHLNYLLHNLPDFKEDWTKRVEQFKPVPVMNKFKEVFL